MTAPALPLRRLVVDGDAAGQRAEQIVRDALGARRAEVRALFDDKQVRLEGGLALKRGDRVDAGDTLTFPDLALAPFVMPAPEVPLVILREAADLVVVDKPAGLHMHPLRRGEPATLAHAVAARFPEVLEAAEAPREGGAVHRLDEHTSGAAVFARSRSAFLTLREAFSGGRVGKRYLALVSGVLGQPVTTTAAIGHDPSDPRRMIVDDGERAPRGEWQPATSTLTPLVTSAARSLILVEMHEGRRHQVRVHCAQLGHPLVGDPLYGGPTLDDEGPLLHAAAVRLPGGIEVSAPALSRFLPHGLAAALLKRLEGWLANDPFGPPPPVVDWAPETG